MKSDEEMRRRARKLLFDCEVADRYEGTMNAMMIFAAEARESAIRECAKVCRQDSVLDWCGGSTGSAKGTANRCADAIERLLPPPKP